MIAAEFRQQPNVIGYDLINEPYVDSDVESESSDAVENISLTALEEYFNTVKMYCEQIRSVDKITPIVIEPTFWAKPCALPLLSDFVDQMRVSDPNIIVSVHFYEPQRLVSRSINKGRYRSVINYSVNPTNYYKLVNYDN